MAGGLEPPDEPLGVEEPPPRSALLGSSVPHFFLILLVQLLWPFALPTLASLHSLKACSQMNCAVAHQHLGVGARVGTGGGRDTPWAGSESKTRGQGRCCFDTGT